MFGRLPAYGFHCRHVRGLMLDGVEVATISPDQRPALVCDDIEGLELTGWRATGSPDAPEIVLRNVRGAFLHGCRPGPKSAAFVRVKGDTSRDICVAATARHKEHPLLDCAPELAPEAVRLGSPRTANHHSRGVGREHRKETHDAAAWFHRDRRGLGLHRAEGPRRGVAAGLACPRL